jgi:hypothetical protein
MTLILSGPGPPDDHLGCTTAESIVLLFTICCRLESSRAMLYSYAHDGWRFLWTGEVVLFAQGCDSSWGRCRVRGLTKNGSERDGGSGPVEKLPHGSHIHLRLAGRVSRSVGMRILKVTPANNSLT